MSAVFSVTVSPTRELYEAPINGQLVPCRVWKGFTAGGVAIEAYVISIVPLHEHDHERMKAELPDIMKPSREVYDIDVSARKLD